MGRYRLLALIALACLLGGCGITHSELTLLSQDHRHDFTQTFSHVYSSLNENGDYDVVLVHDANADRLADSDGTVKPAVTTPRQVVHIRVYWLPQHGAKLDHPAAANATIRWYVFGDRPDETANVLEYCGSGLVLISPKGLTATITVRGAHLQVAVRRGQMADPLGPSSLTGVVSAEVDRHRVDDLLAEVKAADQVSLLDASGVNRD